MRKAVLGLACFVALQLIGPVAYAQSAVKIGLIMTYTGQFTDAAAQMDNGIKLYMKQNGDTVGGKKLEFIRKDTAGAPDAAKTPGARADRQ
jgi:branched-chain amino acid transport system substrate-binding protein